MIGYVTLGTNDLQRAGSFYDALLKPLGAVRMMEDERFIAWTGGEGKTGIGLTKPFDGNTATVGNGVMVALEANSPEQVQEVHRHALEMGGTDEGAPGPRSDMEGFYAGYFRDPDGNKLNVFCFTSA